MFYIKFALLCEFFCVKKLYKKHIFYFFSNTIGMIKISDKKQSLLNISENESLVNEVKDDFKE